MASGVPLHDSGCRCSVCAAASCIFVSSTFLISTRSAGGDCTRVGTIRQERFSI
jgi:hypothetical protein